MTVMAPELVVSRWFHTAEPVTLAALRGKIVVLHAFQMLCPGCVAHALPQTERLHRALQHRSDIAVIGLHTVFEHHAAMTPVSLAAFLHEYRLTFPVGVDQPSGDDGIPITMRRYGMRGTPTTIVIDPAGHIVEHVFGAIDDLALGLLVGSLTTSALSHGGPPHAGTDCTTGACPVDTPR